MYWLVFHGATVWQAALGVLALGAGGASVARALYGVGTGAASRRRALGEPRTAVSGAAEGGEVTLAGTLEAGGSPGTRFEDGAPCAAASAGSAEVASVVDSRAEHL